MRATAIKDGKPVITEKQLQELVRKAAKLLGYLFYHTFNAYRSPKGFPDVTMVRPKDGRLIFVELKSAKGKVTAEQQEWLDALDRVSVNCEVFVLRPDGFDDFFERLK